MMERGRTLSNRTKEAMFSLLAEHASTGRPVKEFCEQKGLSPGMFYYWQKKYKSRFAADQQAGGFTLLASEAYISLLKGHEILISMDGKGRALDN